MLEARCELRTGDQDLGIVKARKVALTPAGQKAFPILAAEEKVKSAKEIFGEVSAKAIQEYGSAHKGDAITMCFANVRKEAVQGLGKLLGLTERYTRKLYRLAMERDGKHVCPLTQQQKAIGQKRKSGITNLTSAAVASFFLGEDVSAVCSGAKTETREVSMARWEIRAKFYAEYPSVIRKLVADNPWLLDAIREILKKKAKLGRFETSVLSAVAIAQKSGFDLKEEITSRLQEANAEYAMELQKNRWRHDGWSKKEILSVVKDRGAFLATTKLGDEDASCDGDSPLTENPIYVPPEAQFWALIKKEGIKWTANVRPTECKIHDKGPQWLKTLEVAEAQEQKAHDTLKAHQETFKEGETAGENRLRELAAKVRLCENNTRQARVKVARLTRHEEQYKQCRPIAKEIEAKMLAGDLLIYRDFVAQYNCDGGKIANLVLVLMWRENDDGVLHTFKFNNFCSNGRKGASKKENSADAFYVADVFEFLLGQEGEAHPGLINEIRNFAHAEGRTPRLFIVGDHGTHFVDVQTLFNESTFRRRFGFATFVFFLCSYHAFNRCDGAGVESIRLQKAATKVRQGWKEADEFAHGLNVSRYHNSAGFDFKRIKRDPTVFPAALRHKKKQEQVGWKLRQRCEVRFSWFEDGIELSDDGVILVRYIPQAPPRNFWSRTGEISFAPGEGDPFEVLDLRIDPPDGLLCEPCSRSLQRPVRHGLGAEGCTAATKEAVSAAVKTQCKSLSGPDPERITPASIEYAKDQARRKKPKGSHPCKARTDLADFCSFHHYNSAATANKHMRDYHHLEVTDPIMYPSAAKKKKPTGQYPCKGASGTCPKWYVYPGRANMHMIEKHDVPIESELLYPIKKKESSSKQRGKIKKGVVHSSEDETDDEYSEGDSEEEEQDEDADEADASEKPAPEEPADEAADAAEVENGKPKVRAEVKGDEPPPKVKVDECSEGDSEEEEQDLVPIEAKRKATIRCNHEYLASLGLVPIDMAKNSNTKATKRNRPSGPKKKPSQPTRSAPHRACKTTPSYTESEASKVEVEDPAEDEHEPGEYYLEEVNASKWERSNGVNTLWMKCKWCSGGETWEPETNVTQEWRNYVRKQKWFVDAPTYWKKKKKQKNEP